MNPPLASLDPAYPFLSRYPSPVECDVLEEPLLGNHPPTKYQDPRIHSSDNEGEAQDSALRLPHRCPPTSPAHQDKGDLLAFPGVAASSCYPSLLAGYHYGRRYSDGFHGFDDSGFHSASPVHVLAPNPCNVDAHPLRTGTVEPSLRVALNIDACLYSPHFSPGHRLNPHFVRNYQLGDELGSGGYGFVMTARHRAEGHEVAVKFIIKRKVPDHAWVEDETIGRLPTEVMLLSCIDHKNVVKCFDLFEDSLYFYLVRFIYDLPSTLSSYHPGSRIAWFSMAKIPAQSTFRSFQHHILQVSRTIYSIVIAIRIHRLFG